MSPGLTIAFENAIKNKISDGKKPKFIWPVLLLIIEYESW